MWRCSYKKKAENKKSARTEVVPVMRKRPQKQLNVRLSDVAAPFCSGQVVLFLYSFFSTSAVTFSIALDISGTKGEPLWKTCGEEHL